jgi:phenylacetic acid degradation operon negative regulatory protein
MPAQPELKVAPLPEFDHLLARADLRANSLLLTIFGDTVMALGGAIWLKHLIELAGQFSLTDRLVRTGVYRLSRDGWLVSRQDGRRAHYSITAQGRERFLEAEARIYAVNPPRWDGRWRLVQLLPGIDKARRAALRRDLQWLGFGPISHGLLAHPTASKKPVGRILAIHNAQADVLAFEARMEDFTGSEAIRNVAARVWALPDMNRDYERFLACFDGLQRALPGREIEPRLAFGWCILLVHQYRILLLKDPQLPEALLPNDWAGGHARALCQTLYRRLAGGAQYHARTVMARDHGELTHEPFYFERFGGLPRASRHSGLTPLVPDAGR